jgi:DNA-binding NarL/FixJ family response regulator
MKHDLSKKPVRESETSATGGRLTKRELEILRLFAQGLGGKAIADRLSISYATARNHAQQILVKLGVHNRAAAVARGYERGILSPASNREEMRRGQPPGSNRRGRA